MRWHSANHASHRSPAPLPTTTRHATPRHATNKAEEREKSQEAVKQLAAQKEQRKKAEEERRRKAEEDRKAVEEQRARRDAEEKERKRKVNSVCSDLGLACLSSSSRKCLVYTK